jgi:predicted nucleic acid-binding protein
MHFEIEKHKNKLLKISKLTPKQLDESSYQLFKRITFINESLIPEKTWKQAEKLVENFDVDDTDFVALTKHVKGYLWTGDKVLYNGLKKLDFKNVITTSELFTLRETKLEK